MSESEDKTPKEISRRDFLEASGSALLVAQRSKEIEGAEIVEGEFKGKKIIKEIRLKTDPSRKEDNAHIGNFLDCIRTKQKPNLDAEAGYHVMLTIALGIKSYRENRICRFDPVKQELGDSSQAKG